MDSLGRDMRVSALWDWKEACKEIRAMEKLRVDGRDTIVVGSPFLA
jgi:hypothetical protein